MSSRLSSIGQYLYDHLRTNVAPSSNYKDNRTINVGGVGTVVSAAYEQLRNAAEYTQEHLLRQRAIRRFYSRNLSFGVGKEIDKAIGEELVIELTQAGYVENNSIPYDVTAIIYDKVTDLYQTYWSLLDKGVDKATAEQWILDVLSVDTETVISQDDKTAIFLQLAFRHYKEALDRQHYIKGDEDSSQYEASLYVAIHRSLLKSDLATIRADMIKLYGVQPSQVDSFIAFNTTIDRIFPSSLSDQLTKHISRYGAPLRVLRSMIEDDPSTASILGDKRKFLSSYESRIAREYSKANAKLNSGVVKSIVFLLLTKVFIGLFIEIPYDLAVMGEVALLPLAVNLLFPAVYLIVLRLGLKTPSDANTNALVDYVESMLYEDARQVMVSPRQKTRQYPIGYSILYAAMFIVAFSVVINRLISLDFNIVQGAIFFVFLASASFLGFRLSRIIRELELVTAKAGIISIIRDFLYFPFTVLGQKISDKYTEINLVSLILDTAIELPLKTVLRLLRQWSSFINDQKDRL